MKVNTDELNRQETQLRVMAHQLSEIQESVLWIARKLSNEEVGEKFERPLRNAARSISSQVSDVKLMCSALLQIADLYDRTEEKVIDEAQSASIHHPWMVIDDFIIPDIRPPRPIIPEFILVGPDGMLDPPGSDSGFIDWTPAVLVPSAMPEFIDDIIWVGPDGILERPALDLGNMD